VDSASAREAVRADLELMRSRFETLPEITNDIDTRNARFSGVALRKLMYLLRQDRQNRRPAPADHRLHCRRRRADFVFDVFRCELLPEGLACLYTSPAQRQQVAPQKLQRPAPADTDALRKAALIRLQRPFSRAAVVEFVEQALAGRTRRSIEVAAPVGDEEYVRLIHIVLYGLETSSAYRFTQAPGRIKHAPYAFPAGDLERKPRKR
jgi:Wadjet anti plasmid transformation system JetA-like protein